MIFEILDNKKEASNVCFLAKANLLEYIKNLPHDFDDYDVQREIVSNIYLDNLIDTVLNKNHIPSITLIVDNIKIIDTTIHIESFKILDGLQRTYRLKVIYESLKLFYTKILPQNEIDSISLLKISRQYKYEIDEIDTNTKIISKIIKYYKNNTKSNIEDIYNNNHQWFEIWSNLNPDEEVRKMLLLNAGHKPVKTKHQVELIFNNTLAKFHKVADSSIKIVREKEKSSIQFNKSRKTGEYHFSSLISAIVSFLEGKPVLTNVAFINKVQNDISFMSNFTEKVTFSLLDSFINNLYALDQSIYTYYKDDGTKWLGKDVVLSSLFAAIGKNCTSDNIEKDVETLFKKLSLNVELLEISNYERKRNSLNLAKINIGTINRKVIYEGIINLIKNDFTKKIDWNVLFAGVTNEN